MALINVLWDYYDAEGYDSFQDAANNVKAKYAASMQTDGFFMWVMPKEKKRHYAYNPIIFKAYYCKVTTSNPSRTMQGSFVLNSTTYYYYVADGTAASDPESVEASLTLYSDSALTKDIATLKADTLQGVATFNAAAVVRSLLAQDYLSMPFSSSSVIITETNKSTLNIFYATNLKVSGSHNTSYLTYYVENAVAQTGNNGEKKFVGQYFLQDHRELIVNVHKTEAGLVVEDAFPRITMLSGAIGTWDVYWYTPGGRSYMNITWGIGAFELRVAQEKTMMMQELVEYTADFVTYNNIDGTGINGLVAQANIESDRRPFKVRIIDCPFEQTFPIRWRNRKGVAEYYTFLGNGYKIKESKTTGVKDRYIEDASLVNTNRIPYAIDASRKLKLGINNATTEEIDVLTKLPYSPWIEWYDYANMMWTRVTVAEFKNTEQMNNPGNDFEITFECPAVNTQFE